MEAQRTKQAVTVELALEAFVRDSRKWRTGVRAARKPRVPTPPPVAVRAAAITPAPELDEAALDVKTTAASQSGVAPVNGRAMAQREAAAAAGRAAPATAKGSAGAPTGAIDIKEGPRTGSQKAREAGRSGAAQGARRAGQAGVAATSGRRPAVAVAAKPAPKFKAGWVVAAVVGATAVAGGVWFVAGRREEAPAPAADFSANSPAAAPSTPPATPPSVPAEPTPAAPTAPAELIAEPTPADSAAPPTAEPTPAEPPAAEPSAPSKAAKSAKAKAAAARDQAPPSGPAFEPAKPAAAPKAPAVEDSLTGADEVFGSTAKKKKGKGKSSEKKTKSSDTKGGDWEDPFAQ